MSSTTSASLFTTTAAQANGLVDETRTRSFTFEKLAAHQYFFTVTAHLEVIALIELTGSGGFATASMSTSPMPESTDVFDIVVATERMKRVSGLCSRSREGEAEPRPRGGAIIRPGETFAGGLLRNVARKD
ncbi:MAG: hypothetical protein AB7Q81_09050 [Gammaproteobacteria bacterium]